ncbi:MAG: hypothetical protein JO099_08610 [Acidobacteriia bacterium]|nr:hypothetical protein [Terriglobia bacterium]
MDIASATRIAEEYVARLNTDTGPKFVLLRDETIEREFGWVFFYGPQDESITVAGNAPFVVDRNHGSIHATGTAHPIETYLDSYAHTGRTDPLAVPEHLVVLDGWKRGMLKVSLTKAIRAATGKNLAEAKNCTDLLLAGKSVSLTLATSIEADRFCATVQELGVLARRETRYH